MLIIEKTEIMLSLRANSDAKHNCGIIAMCGSGMGIEGWYRQVGLKIVVCHYNTGTSPLVLTSESSRQGRRWAEHRRLSVRTWLELLAELMSEDNWKIVRLINGLSAPNFRSLCDRTERPPKLAESKLTLSWSRKDVLTIPCECDHDELVQGWMRKRCTKRIASFTEM